mgnify:CR=1 FL=1
MTEAFCKVLRYFFEVYNEGTMKRVTLSVIKADVGSVGGHTKPHEKMLKEVREMVAEAKFNKLLIDADVKYTGDDICLIMSHAWGTNAPIIHKFAWDCFKAATRVAAAEGCYGAGQDLLVDAPSGNVRGAGPGVAEIEFVLDKNNKERPVESFLVFAGDKCGPGMFNLPLYQTFCDPMHDGGLLLNPKMNKGFKLSVIDMDHKDRDHDRVIELEVPEKTWDVAALLRDMDRFGIEAVYSRYQPNEQIVAVSAMRLHNIAGKYTGKDDPVALVRTQGMFPAPEELIEPYLLGHFVSGDARGSHVMPIMPVAINTTVAGAYCLPIVSCMAYSMNEEGYFSGEGVDIFGNNVWEATRQKIVRKAEEFRRQGFFGATMAGNAELAYTGIVEAINKLDHNFVLRRGSNYKEEAGK